MKKALLVLMCGLLLFGVAALADVHFGHEPDEHGMDLRFGDGNELRFGLVASMFWETEDTNANYLAIELPTGGAVDVPVLAIGVAIDGEDLTLFHGQTFPSVVLMDGDNDSYVALTWAGDDLPEIEVGGKAESITIPGITAYTWNDDVDLAFGTGSPGSIEWTTADPNANCFIFDMPAGDGTDVPGVGIVTTDADFTYFNGETAPFFFIEDDDGDSYIFLGWSDDDKAEFVGGGSVSELNVDFTLIRNTTEDFRIEYDADAYIKFAVSNTTGNVAITQTGSTRNVAWTTTGAVTFTFGSLDLSGMAVTIDEGTITGITDLALADGGTGVSAVDPVVLSQRHRVTTAEINEGHELLPAIADKQYRMVSCVAIAYGEAVGAVTTVDILGTQTSSVKLVAYAQASLTQSAVLTSGGTGTTVLADGASYEACDANKAITIGVTGDDVTTATGVDIIIQYVIE